MYLNRRKFRTVSGDNLDSEGFVRTPPPKKKITLGIGLITGGVIGAAIGGIFMILFIIVNLLTAGGITATALSLMGAIIVSACVVWGVAIGGLVGGITTVDKKNPVQPINTSFESMDTCHYPSPFAPPERQADQGQPAAKVPEFTP